MCWRASSPGGISLVLSGLRPESILRQDGQGAFSLISVSLIPMQAFDTVVLDVIESLCRSFQRLTGRTNVWLAVQLTNVSIVMYFVWAALYFWQRDLATRLFVGL